MISEELQHFLLDFCEPENPLLKEIDRETQLKVLMPKMVSGHYQGRVLGMFSQLMAPRRILEVGTFTGYATLCLAEGLSPDGEIYTIDVNEELAERVQKNFAKSGVSEKIKYIVGNATTVIPQLNEIWDIVFIDADKKNNETYYDMVFDAVRPGGLIIVDNVLWSGKVLKNAQDSDTKNIANFNHKIAADARVEKLILPVRDGLFLIRKK